MVVKSSVPSAIVFLYGHSVGERSVSAHSLGKSKNRIVESISSDRDPSTLTCILVGDEKNVRLRAISHN